MTAQPDTQAEKDHQNREAGDVEGLDERFGPGIGVVQRIEALGFTTHDRDCLPARSDNQ